MNAPRFTLRIFAWGLLTLLCLPLRGWPPWEKRDFILDWVEGAEQQTSVPDATGGFVVAWTAPGEEGAGREVFVHAFDAVGQPRWPLRTANAWTAGDQAGPSLAPLAEGGFAVAWNSPGQDGGGLGLVLRRFGAAGEPLEDERVISAPRAGDQRGAIHPLLAGGFVAAWTTPGPRGAGQRLVVRRYSETGEPVAPAVRLHTFGSAEAFHQMAVGPDGSLLAVWSVKPRNPCAYRARRFGLDGRSLGPSFGLCTYTAPGVSAPPSVSVGPAGIVSVWPGAYGIWARRYGLDGAPLGPAFRVDRLHELYPKSPVVRSPRVAHASSGAFLVVWDLRRPDDWADATRVVARAFGPQGEAWGSEETLFEPWAAHGGDQRLRSFEPRVAPGPQARFSVIWRTDLPAVKGTVFTLVPPPPVVPADEIVILDPLVGVNEEDGVARVRVRRSGGVGLVSLRYWTDDLSATPEADYLPVSGVLTWAPGDFSEREITVPIVADGLPEEPESFEVRVGALRGETRTASVYIDAPGFPGFLPDVHRVLEGSGGVELPVARLGGRKGRLSVHFWTSEESSSAQPGRDYLPVAGTLVWDDGDTSLKTFVIPLLDDTEAEDREDIEVDLSAGSSPRPLSAWTLVTLEDDETSPAPGALGFVPSSPVEVREGDGSVLLRLGRQGGLGGTVSVRYAVAGGTATPGEDFTAASGVLTWGDSDVTLRGLRIQIRDDTRPEGDETFEVTLSAPRGGAALGEPAVWRVTIHDDDAAQRP